MEAAAEGPVVFVVTSGGMGVCDDRVVGVEATGHLIGAVFVMA